MPALSDRALVLRRQPFGESSLVAQVLTERHGRVHLLAKGAYRPSSGYFAVLDLFDTLELEWSPAPEGALGLLRRGSVARRRASLCTDLARYARAIESLELAELGSREGAGDPALYALLEASLERLETRATDPAVERIVFDLAFLQNLGLAPRLASCASCGTAEPAPPPVGAPAPPVNRRARSSGGRGARVAFSSGAGGRLCQRCALEAQASGRRVDYPMEELLRVAHSLASADPARLGSIRVDPGLARRIGAFVEGFLEYHLEARPRSRRAPGASPPRASAIGGALLALLVLLPLASCTALGFGKKHEIPPSEASARFASAQAELDAGRADEAIEDLADLWETPNLDPDLRLKIDASLERCTNLLLVDLEKPGADPDDAEDLWDLPIPRRLRVRFGLAEARLLLAEGERVDCFRTVRAIDKEFPTHEARAAAGALVAEAGFSLAADPGHYFFFFTYRGRAPELLEYLVLTYPADARCAEAYWTLGQIYEQEDEVELAIERLEDLVVYHPECQWAAQAALDVPRLRAVRLERPDHDRGTLRKARAEVDAWIAAHAGHELMPSAEALRRELRSRESESDLRIAYYYERIDEPFGARLHAERAAEEARAAGDAAREQRAQKVMQRNGAPAPPAPEAAAAETLDKLDKAAPPESPKTEEQKP